MSENYLARALDKLAVNPKGKKEIVMAPALREWLSGFCKKDAEFAQAVAQGGTFQECVSDVAKNSGNAISDFDAISKAVQFYFPGAKVKFEMILTLAGDTDSGAADNAGDALKILDLADFL